MKRLLFAAALLLSLSVAAQNKMLSSKQLMTRNLYPQAPMRGLQFVGNTDQIAYVQDTVLYMGKPGKTKACLTQWAEQGAGCIGRRVDVVSSLFQGAER